MALLKKVVMLAITTGLAKTAWDAYKQKNPMAAGRLRSNLKEAGRMARRSDMPTTRTDKPNM